MKNRNIINILFLLIATFSLGCGDRGVDPGEPTALEIQLELLKNNNKSWSTTSGSVIKDGYDVSSQFSGFALKVDNFTYTTTNGLDSAWPRSGTWEFSNNNPNKIIRDDGVLMDINLLNNELALTFNVSGINGRVKGIDGEYTFILSGE